MLLPQYLSLLLVLSLLLFLLSFSITKIKETNPTELTILMQLTFFI